MRHENIFRVLFLCTGNSCRSQMAEAIINHQSSHQWIGYSAGTQPAGYVHPKALEVLREIGIEHRGQSKHVDALVDIDFDLVVTVCDAAAENCPLWLGSGKRIHHSFPDPAKATGNPDDILKVFREVRDRILQEIPEICDHWAEEYNNHEMHT